ncbi:MAG: hypothetical protein DWP92_07950 [Armatimonadetes bacterium]|nr:MAG: hypothetical protein DWP92_07950 [Armatimonadota bacterium]
MSLSPIRSHEEADWVESTAVLGRSIRDLLPGSLAQVVALEHPESTGSLPQTLADQLAQALAALTEPSGRVIYCVWDGWAGSTHRPDDTVTLSTRRTWRRRRQTQRPADLDVVRKAIPHRTYWVFEGSLQDALTSHTRAGFQSANVWWPIARTWAVATEIGAAATYVGLRADQPVDAVLAIDGARLVEPTDAWLSEPSQS